MTNDDNGPASIDWKLGLHGGGSGILRQVPFGLGDGPTRVLIEMGLSEDGQGVTMALTVGDGPDLDDGMEAALLQVADMLDGFTEALRDSIPDLAQAYVAAQAEGGDNDGE